ncbi:MBL fold metallo-hydrolase, partial [Arthrobacter sp.]
QVAETVNAPVYLHPDDVVLWEQVYLDVQPDKQLKDGDVFQIAGAELRALHTPGHSPGSSCFLLAEQNVVFTGDTLFNGGPGATGRSYSDYPTILASIQDKLLALPDETVVHTGHGEDTTIGAERLTLASLATD